MQPFALPCRSVLAAALVVLGGSARSPVSPAAQCAPGRTHPAVPATPAPAGRAAPERPPPPPSRGGAASPSPPLAVPAPTPTAVTGLRTILDERSWAMWWDYNGGAWSEPGSLVELPATRAGEGTRSEELGGGAAIHAEVVPSILSELAREPDARFVRAALFALARIGEPPEGASNGEVPSVLLAIRPWLASPDRHLRDVAVIALGVLASNDAAVLLAELLGDTPEGARLGGARSVPERTRALAAYGLGLLGELRGDPATSRYAVHHLVNALEGASSHADLQIACVIALGMADPAPADALLEYLLARFLDERAPKGVRRHAPTAMARLCAGASHEVVDRVVTGLVETVRRTPRVEPELARSAVLALGRLGDSDGDAEDVEIRAALMRAMQSRDHLVRCFAGMALAEAASRPGVGTGAPLEGERDAARFLVHHLARGKSRQKPWAGLALGVLGHRLREEGRRVERDAADALWSAVTSSRSPEDGAAYSLAVALLGDGRARSRVLENLGRFQDPLSRGHAATALGLLGDPRDVEVLTRLMDEAGSDPLVLEAAAVGRALLGDAGVVDDLLARLEGCDDWVSLMGVAGALARTRDPRAITPLAVVLADAERSAWEKSLAVEALGRIADKAPGLPWRERIASGLDYADSSAVLSDRSGTGVLDWEAR